MIRIERGAYSIGFDRLSQIMTIILRGYWDSADQTAYESELNGAIAMLSAEGCKPGDQLMLVDITEHAVQSAGALEMFARLTSDKIISGRRQALVLSSTLVKMQAKRTAPNYRIFEDRDAAIAWLRGSEA